MVFTRTGEKKGLQKEDVFISNCLNGKVNCKGTTLEMLNNAISMVQHQLNEFMKENNSPKDNWPSINKVIDTLIAERYLLCKKKEQNGEALLSTPNRIV